MARLLKHNICGLLDASLPHSGTPDFGLKRGRIPLALRYACRHWLYHLQQLPPDDEIQGLFLDFLQSRLTFAIEAYAIFGELATGLQIFRTARKLVLGWPTRLVARVAIDLLYDAWRLTLDFFDPISTSALHVYESALPCSPAKSALRLTYQHLLIETSSLRIKEGLDEQWGLFTRVIDMKTNDFKLALSPDGSQVAAISQNVICVWATATGLLRALHHNINPSSRWSTKFLYNAESEALRGPLAFSHSGSKIACLWTRRTIQHFHPIIRIYDVKTCQQLSHIYLPSINIDQSILDLTASFSHSDDRLMTHVLGCTLLFDTSTGNLIGRTGCCDENLSASWCFFDPSDDSVIHVSWREHGPLVSRLFFTEADGTEALVVPRTSSIPTTRRLESHGEHYQLLRAGPLVARESPVQYTFHGRADVKPEGFPGLEKLTLVDAHPNAIVQFDVLAGIKLGDRILGICGKDRTTSGWMTTNEECFGAIKRNEQIWIIDLAQASLQSFPHTSSPANIKTYLDEAYILVCVSKDTGYRAYQSKTTTNYLVYDAASSPERLLCEIFLRKAQSAIGQPRVFFSPRSKHFLIADSFESPSVQLWNPQYGRHIASAFTPSWSVLEVVFSEDEDVFALQVVLNGQKRIAMYALAGNALELVETPFLPDADVDYPAFCVVASVTREILTKAAIQVYIPTSSPGQTSPSTKTAGLGRGHGEFAGFLRVIDLLPLITEASSWTFVTTKSRYYIFTAKSV
ncbi:hypothetical protein CONPUDRAFT_73723 [Coniophora puteana RWD-64-598 SS2]|uniref:WD40 repeat-like protein n=1 Tax=Coniophora puteana (strain RWD-64-598) TaxID=741705 RepID=A0A5M3MNF8_CONPW|nr:uncharacterized protein CONPUDRAFT_73723 [Coniophora puteana RWD-64-598 SS2]EIW80643.1 hypothetical protein CONPUDRAFT_73723 [Coniophora puteana RWD-64-598 SS2]